MTDTRSGEDTWREPVARAARRAEGALPLVIVAYVLAAAAARVLAIGDVWEGFTVVDAVALFDPGWWGERFRWLGPFIGNPAVYVGVVLLAASLTAPATGSEKPQAVFVHGLRMTTVHALAWLAIEQCGDASARLVPVWLGALALLVATRRGRLPSWQVSLGTWVLACRMGWTSRVFVRWHEPELAPCMTPPATLDDIAPACIALQVSAALALASDRTAPHPGLRMLAAIWALFSALDTGMEVAVGHGLTQREPWFAWVTAWSFVAQGVACATLLALAATAYRSLRAALFDAELHPRVGEKAGVAVVFGLAMLAPVLTRHPLPWDVGDAPVDSLDDVPGVSSLRASWTTNQRADHARTVLIADRSGNLYEAQSGRLATELTGDEYGLIMDHAATVAEFSRVASHVLQQGAEAVRWVLPMATDEHAVGAIPARYAIRGIANRQLIHTNVAAYLAGRHPWRVFERPGDPGVHLLREALEDPRPLHALRDTTPRGGYHVLVDPAPPEAQRRYSGTTLHPVPNPLTRLFRDSAHTMSARLVPLLGGLVLAYFAFLMSIRRDLTRLGRERESGQWLNTSGQLPSDSGLPRFPPWIPAEDAPCLRMEGSPFRETGVARAATAEAAREHVRLRLPMAHHMGGVYAGVMLLFVVVTLAAAW